MYKALVNWVYCLAVAVGCCGAAAGPVCLIATLLNAHQAYFSVHRQIFVGQAYHPELTDLEGALCLLQSSHPLDFCCIINGYQSF